MSLTRSSSQYASISDGSQTGLEPGGDFTFEAWVKPASQPSGGDHFIYSKGSGSTKNSLMVYTDNGGTKELRIYMADGSREDYFWSAQTLPNGTWAHVAFVRNASGQSGQFYVNGSSVTTTRYSYYGTPTSSQQGNSSSWMLGAASNGTANWDGLIDEARMWNVARSGTQISDNYQLELTGSESNLQGYWKLNNNYNDATPNGNDLTPANGPVFSSDAPF